MTYIDRAFPRAARALSVLSVFAVVLVGACAERFSTGPGTPLPDGLMLGSVTSGRPLVGTVWSLQTLNTVPLSPVSDSVRTLRLQRQHGQLLANARVGCNYMGGRADTVGTRFRVANLDATRMWCGDEINALEQRFGEALLEVSYFGLRGDTLWLYDTGFQERARFRAAQ